MTVNVFQNLLYIFPCHIKTKYSRKIGVSKMKRTKLRENGSLEVNIIKTVKIGMKKGDICFLPLHIVTGEKRSVLYHGFTDVFAYIHVYMTVSTTGCNVDQKCITCVKSCQALEKSVTETQVCTCTSMERNVIIVHSYGSWCVWDSRSIFLLERK